MKKLFIGTMTIFLLGFAACSTVEVPAETEVQINYSPWLGRYTYKIDDFIYYILIDNYEKDVGAFIEVRNNELDETIYDFTANIEGDTEEIRFFHVSSSPNRHLSDATQGDLLLTLSLKDNEIYTKWGVLTPINQSASAEGICFIREQ